MDDQSVEIDENRDEIAATEEAGGSESSTNQSGMFQTLRATHDSSEADEEDEEEEEEEDEDEEEEDDDFYAESPFAEEYSSIDLWEVDEVVAFGDDLEIKFETHFIDEIERLLGKARELDFDSALIHPLGNSRPTQTGPVPKTRPVEWINASSWTRGMDILDAFGAKMTDEGRIDREGWHEIIPVWRWSGTLAEPYVLQDYTGGKPSDYRLMAQFNELHKVWNPQCPAANQINAILENLVQQASVLIREKSRETLADCQAKLDRISEPDPDGTGTIWDPYFGSETRDEIQKRLDQAQSIFNEAVAQCRAVGVND